MATALFAPTLAGAQDEETQRRIQAQQLYDEGVAEMAKSAWADACRKLEEVVRLQPQGIGAMLTLASCYEGAGKTASAWARYRFAAEAAQKANDPKHRERDALDKASQLESKLARVNIVVPPAVRGLPGLEVKRDGIVVGEVQFGSAVAADPGQHTVTVAATGKQGWSGTVDVGQAQIAEVAVPMLADLASVAPPPASVTVAPVASIRPPPLPEPHRPPGDARGGTPTWAWVAGGVGVASTIVSVASFAAQASAQSTFNASCSSPQPAEGDPNGCVPKASAVHRDFGLGVGFGAGAAVALGAAIIGIATAPRKAAPAAAMVIEPTGWISARSSGVGLRFAF